jgi:hypothetical protein
MICRLYGEETNTHFRMEWFPMAYMVAQKGQAFNWVSILSFSITKRSQDPKGMKNPEFYMSSYLIDVVCATNSFPTFNWAWTPKKGPIHWYCSQLWECNCKKYFYDICDYFHTPLHKAIFGLFPHIISPGALKGLKEIGIGT